MALVYYFLFCINHNLSIAIIGIYSSFFFLNLIRMGVIPRR